MAAVTQSESRWRRTDLTTAVEGFMWTAVRARSAKRRLRRGQSPRRLGILAIIPACRDLVTLLKDEDAWLRAAAVSSYYSTKFRDPDVCNYQWTTVVINKYLNVRATVQYGSRTLTGEDR